MLYRLYLYICICVLGDFAPKVVMSQVHAMGIDIYMLIQEVKQYTQESKWSLI